MSYDIKLQDGIELTQTGDIVLAKTKKEIALQQLKLNINLLKGSWFLDLNQGNDWLNVLNKRNNKIAVDLTVKSAIKSTKYVDSLLEYSSYYDRGKRKFYATFKALVEDGTIIHIVEQEL